ncbi:hypothetical protein EV360DRAFT_72728 [Lentinula raphanica]|nr:hypothetical protein EV360DRAFT_72728 [Lentinula raphanica]
MARRPSRVLRTLYASRQLRSTSFADVPGVLYAYVDDGHRWKIGMTRNFARRKYEWDKQCPFPNRRWMPPNLWLICYWSFGALIDHAIAVLAVGEDTSKFLCSLQAGHSCGGTLSIRCLPELQGRKIPVIPLQAINRSADSEAKHVFIMLTNVSNKQRTRNLYMTDGMLFWVDPLLSRHSVIIVPALSSHLCATNSLHQNPTKTTFAALPNDAIIVSLEGRMLPVEFAYLQQPVLDYKLIDVWMSLTTEEQLAVFEPAEKGTRQVIVSTNIAEVASVTIEGIKFVIDSEFVEVMRSSGRLKMHLGLTLALLSIVGVHVRINRKLRVALEGSEDLEMNGKGGDDEC